jgi:hypothetical protein
MNSAFLRFAGVDDRFVVSGRCRLGIREWRSVWEFGGALIQRPTRSGEDADAGI